MKQQLRKFGKINAYRRSLSTTSGNKINFIVIVIDMDIDIVIINICDSSIQKTLGAMPPYTSIYEDSNPMCHTLG